ncbi:MAG: YkoF family thiamine/hydroxymethylpyrimidine-binding protein [Halanaerobium sp.]|nr:YkoF family thiamine/hydroxymethylpyrimidine-binding protein [Halanaerobium sp.]
MLRAEVSLYPLNTKKSTQIIKDSLGTLLQYGIKYEAGDLSSQLEGEADQIWKGLQRLFEEAEEQTDEVSMVVKVSNHHEEK